MAELDQIKSPTSQFAVLNLNTCHFKEGIEGVH